MKKRGGRFLLILGAGLAAMAFIVVYIATSKGIRTDASATVVPTVVPTTSIVVVNRDLPAYTVLDESNLSVQQVAASTAVTATATAPEQFFGKMTLAPLFRGQPVLANQVTSSGFSQILGKGKRAITLPVPERDTFAGMLSEADYIDILWTHQYEVSQNVPGPDGKPQEKTSKLPTTKTLLQDVKVMRIVSLMVTPVPQGDTGNAQPAVDTKGAKPAPAAAYTADAAPNAVMVLEVSDQQAEVLKFASENGTLDFTLRSSDGTSKRADGQETKGDHDPERTTGITDKVLVEQYGVLLPEILVK